MRINSDGQYADFKGRVYYSNLTARQYAPQCRQIIHQLKHHTANKSLDHFLSLNFYNEGQALFFRIVTRYKHPHKVNGVDAHEYEIGYVGRNFETAKEYMLDNIPNIRKLSCSPWSKKESFAEQLQGRGLIMSNKPNPAFLSAAYDEDVIRKDLRETMDIAKRYGVNVELIQKDISTVNRKPERLTRWAEIAMEEAMR